MKTIIKAALMAAGAVLCACSGAGNQQSKAGAGMPAEAAEAAPQAAKVEVLKAARETVPQTGVYSSTVQANIVNNIAPQTTGRIVSIKAEVGDFVSEGQVLAEMDKVQLEQAELKLKNSEDELARVKQLLDQGGISQSDYEALELSCKVARSAYQNLLENTVLRSPVTGVVTARNYDKGDMYSMAQPLFTVQQIVPVKLLVGVSESDYTLVSKGDKVIVTADALPGKTFEGSIVRIHPTIDPATHTFNVEVRVRNERRELRPGMYARATIEFGSRSSIVLPDQAAVKMQGAGTRSVFIVDEDGTANSRVVVLGRHFDGKYEILEGIEEGETVVVKGQASLKSGQKVEVAQ